MYAQPLVFSVVSALLLLVFPQTFFAQSYEGGSGEGDCETIIDDLEGNPTDPLSDPLLLIDYDYCCGQDPRPLPCYDFNRVIDIWGYLTDIPIGDDIKVTIKYPDGYEDWFYLNKALGFQHIADEMNAFSSQFLGINPGFEYVSNNRTLCATTAIPNGYDKKYGNITLEYEPCFQQSITGGGNLAPTQPNQCTVVIKPDTINCENYQPHSDFEEFFDANGNYTLENLYLFPGNPGESIPPIYTNDILNSPQEPGLPAGAPSNEYIVFVLNNLMTSGALDMGLGCVNINCFNAQSLIDGLWEDPDIATNLEDYLGSEGNQQDNIDFFNNYLETELAGINPAEEFNSTFGLNLSTAGCPPSEEISWDEIESFGGPPTNQANFKALAPANNANDLNPEYDFFSQDLPGLNAIAPGVSNPSPSALEMIKNVNSGVNLYNGSQNTSVPLYNLQARDLSLPISVSTNNNGLKVDDMGTLLGQHWSLNAGGSISRVTNGLPDEFCGTTDGFGYGRKPKLVAVEKLPSNFGIGLDIPVPLGALCQKPDEKVHQGILIKKIPVGKDEITVRWNPIRPNLIRFTFIKEIFSFGIPFTNIQIVVTVDFGVEAGMEVNQRFGPVKYEDSGIGYLYSDHQDNGCPLPFFSTSGLDYSDMTAINGDEPKPDQLQDIHSNRNVDDQTFLNGRVGNFQQWIDALLLLVEGETLHKTKTLDTEPDEFYFNIGQYSGYFQFIADGQGNKEVVTFPYYQHLKIEPEFSAINGQQHITRFTVTTPEGMEYTYGSSNGNYEGVDFTENLSFYLPNFYTYPEKKSDRETFGEAKIDVGQLVLQPPGFGNKQIVKYANTYDRNYKIMEQPKYTSSWHLVKVKSLLTQEEIDLEYDSRDLHYYSNKSLNHTFPNFGAALEDGKYCLKTKANTDLVPKFLHWHKTRWENGRAELAYSATETRLTRWHLTEMSTNRNESVKFIYEQERGEVVSDKVCSRVEVHRNNSFFKGWQFEYESIEVNSTPFICDELPEGNDTFGIPPVISIEGEWKYDLGTPYSLNFVELFNSFFITLRLNCFTPSFQVPNIFPAVISFAGNHRSQLSELGSLIEVKAFQGLIESTDLNEEMEIFNAERKRTFLRKIWELDRAWTTSDNGEHRHEFITSIEYDNETALPKRFSIHQDPDGYHVDNSQSGSILPELKFDNWYDFNQINPILQNGTFPTAAKKLIYGFQNANLPGSQIHLGRAKHNFNYAKNGSIKRIQLATGAEISYQYESNELPGGAGLGGGIRVKELTEDPFNSPAKVTNYSYQEPTVCADPIWIYQNPLNHYYSIGNGTGSEVLESRVITSSSPQNRIWQNKAGFIGYKIVTEEWDGIGKKVHQYSSPDEIPHDPRANGEYEVFTEHRWRMEHIRESAFNFPSSFAQKEYFEWYDHPYWRTPKMISNSFIKFALDHVGIEKHTETYDAEGSKVHEVQTELTCTNVSERLLYLVSDMYHFNDPGSHSERFAMRLLKSYQPFKKSIVNDLVSILVDLIFNGGIFDHPFKEVRRNYLVKELRVRSYKIKPGKVTTYNYYPDGTSSWSISDYHYGYNSSSNKELLSHLAPLTVTTTYSDGNVVLVENVFGLEQGNPNYPGLQHYQSSGILGYLQNNLPEYFYSVPLYSKVKQNGTLVGKEMSVPKPLNNRVVPYLSYTLFNGQEGLAGKVDGYNAEGMPTSYRLAKFGAIPSSSDFFDPITMTWNSRLQMEDRTYEGLTTDYIYDGSTFELITVTDPDGVVSEYSYDLRGRLEEELSLNGRQRKEYNYSIGPGDNRRSVTTFFTDGAITTQFREVFMDGFGKELSIKRNQGQILKSYGYDNFFRVISEYNLGSGQVDIERHNSPIERYMSTQDAVGNLTETTYSTSSAGFQITTVVDANGHESKSYTDALGRVTKTESAEGSITQYEYDNLSRLEKIINPIQEEYQYEYNDIGQVWRKKIPGSADQYICWSESFRPILTVDGNSNVEIRTYDDLNRVTAVHAPNSTPATPAGGYAAIVDDGFFDADKDELLMENTFVSGKTWLSSTRVRVLTDANANGFGGYKQTDNQNLDDLGRPGTIVTTYPDGSVTHIPTYADAGVILEQSVAISGPEPITADYTFQFDQFIRPTLTRLDFNGEGSKVTSWLKYNNQDQVITKHLGAVEGGGFLQNIDFGYDAIGRLININTPSENECIKSRPTCKVSTVISISGRRYFYRVTGVEIEGQFYTFQDPIILGEPNDTKLLVLAIQEAIQYFDHSGDAEVFVDIVPSNQGPIVEYTININGASFTSAVLHYQQCEYFSGICTNLQAPFDVEECCDKELPEDVPPPVSLLAPDDLFYEQIQYDGLDISQIDLYSDCTTGHMRNEYTYDGNHRLKTCRNTLFHPTEGRIDNAYTTGYSYDLAGNILTLQRNGYIPPTSGSGIGTFAQLIDDLAYDASNPTQPSYVEDQASAQLAEFGLQGTTTLAYDAVGNVWDTDRAMGQNFEIDYNRLNLPQYIEATHNGSTFGQQVDYTYDREKTKHLYTSSSEQRIYIGGAEFKDGNLEFYAHQDGRIVKDPDNGEFRWQYTIQDHLGNTVVLFEDRDTDGTISTELDGPASESEVLQRNYYYSFGMEMNGPWQRDVAPEQSYLYNGKEKISHEDVDLRWLNYGFRWYDPAIGRFTGVDPLAHEREWLSPYNYVQNNPILRIDPTGALDGIFVDEDGKQIGNDGNDDGKVYVINTQQKDFGQGVAGAGLSRKDAKAAKKFIKQNSGNKAAFEGNASIYDNFTEIESNASTRQGMVDAVSGDNGKGGTSASNNREYGGSVMPDGSVVPGAPGPVTTPREGATFSDYQANDKTRFHSHPSGEITETSGGGDPFGGTTTLGTTTTIPYNQPPSPRDVSNASSNVRYVFGKGSDKVYIYNNQGVRATLPIENFVKFK